MDLRKCLLTNNDCYKTGRKITPIGVMWHSTGANNPNLKRYVQPDDGLLGTNNNGNHWNKSKPDGRQVCVHAFIGKDKNGNVATYQTLPWNYRGWHCGGAGNDRYISFEICEDGLTDKNYFNKVYKEAVELTAYLCKMYGLNPIGQNVIICHQDGYRLGIASNHGDVYHWFKKHGKTMDNVRKDVANAMNGQTVKVDVDTPTEVENNQTPSLSIEHVAKEVLSGKWGNGDERKKKLEAAGYDYIKVQAEVNKLSNSSSISESSHKKDVITIVNEVIAGKWGNGDERKKKLEAAGYDYIKVQAEVNKQLGSSSNVKTSNGKSIDTIAKEVIAGKWGNGDERRKKLEAAGYDYNSVQSIVNQLLS